MNTTADETFREAVAALQAGRVDAAERLFKRVLQTQPRQVPALNLLSISLVKMRRFDEAAHYARLALEEDATSDASFFNYGLILRALGRDEEALAQFTKASKINNSVAETWNHRGIVLVNLRRYREAIVDLDRAVALGSTAPEVFANKARALAELMYYDEAQSVYRRALALNPNLIDAWLGYGNVLTALKQFDDALAAYDRALALKTDLAEAWVGRGNVFFELNQMDNAFEAFERALEIRSDIGEAWLGRGNAFARLNQYENAVSAHNRALALRPDLPEGWLAYATVLSELKRYDDALAAYERAVTLKPNLNYAVGARLVAKLHLCDWTSLKGEVAQLLSMIRDGKLACFPFVSIAIPASPADQLQCARLYVQDQPVFPRLWNGERYSHDRLRVAYLSADFHDHATAQLAVGLFEKHDRSRFETFGISYGPDSDSPMRRRIKDAFEHFIDVRSKSDQEVGGLLCQHEIDIAIDLKGFTRDSRFNIMARRFAPVQVSYLGYPGTMGASYIDYIIADPIIIPEDECAFYSEQVVWLPFSYQINDNRRSISDHFPTRRECGLPDTGFVFCCFNNNYKITPQIFDIWMRLLKSDGDSVLWLFGDNPIAAKNLRWEAERLGVSPQRLIFAPRVKPPDHLARHRLADLFLDTLPYNAHTTASDALWAGLPVLTCMGSTFAGRVAASLLMAVGLDELVTQSLPEYEALAARLAHEPSYLASLRERLARNRGSSALFDTSRVTRQIESAYEVMWQRFQKGEKPGGESRQPIRIGN
jgi:predicted O-linked N-acetylglucosamine transferase (SPINDLY family)